MSTLTPSEVVGTNNHENWVRDAVRIGGTLAVSFVAATGVAVLRRLHPVHRELTPRESGWRELDLL